MTGRIARLLLSLLCLSLLPFAAVAQTVGTVNFDFDSDQLDAQALQQVRSIADSLKASPSYKPTVVVGYTDAVGTSAYNRDLGRRRAQRVAEALVAAGVPVDRVGSIESRGKSELLVAVATPERRNRRVTVTLDDILKACRTYREVQLDASSVGDALQNDLESRLADAVANYSSLKTNGLNGPAYQMAGAAREDCNRAVGFKSDSIRKVEYAKKCFCSSARMQVALGLVTP
ncbi:OmpA family protein [Primorskyibacter sp. S87]|uniref:OmpA family protein n=1 Tax=Primorskyibacter sp. S87 TaxID=3415126 RepID=UPI003C7E1AED